MGDFSLNHPIWVMTFHPGFVYTAVMIFENKVKSPNLDQQYMYQIQIVGEIDQIRSDWFARKGFESSWNLAEHGITVIKGIVLDQSHLRGILNKLWDLNFEVILVEKLGLVKKECKQ